MIGKTSTVKWSGLEGLKDDLKNALPEEALKAFEIAEYETAETIMTAAKQLTPVDEGVLRASGNVQLPLWSGNTVSTEMGFGGPAGSGNMGETNKKDVGYAVYVHENLDAHHNSPTQAKYLEQPFDANKGMLPKRIAEILRKEK